MHAHLTDIQRSTERLYGILAGVSADYKLKDAEIIEFNKWLSANEYLHNTEPFKDIVAIINRVFLLFLLLFLLLVFVGCQSAVTIWRKNGRADVRKSFALISPSPQLCKKIVLKNVKIIVVGQRAKFDCAYARDPENKILGYARTSAGRSVVWIIGKRVNGRIVVDQYNLGHEINHLLNFVDPQFVDPDMLDELGL